MEETGTSKELNLRIVVTTLWASRKQFLKILGITFVVASLIIISVPRYYRCEIQLAPEWSSGGAMSGLSSLASSFGFDLADNMTSDAISPELYPDLMMSKEFQTGLFDIRVKSIDGEIDTTYYAYLDKYQKKAWWEYPKEWVGFLFKIILPQEPDLPASAVEAKGTVKEVNPFALNRRQTNIAKKIEDKVRCHVDTKTYVITISVEDQDKLICATMAEEVRKRLQAFITRYRTNKARIDVEFYEQITFEAKEEYDEATRAYSSFSDANNDIVLQVYRSKLADLENNMQIKFNTYSTMMTQLQAAKARVQENTPAFTILQGATIPLNPAGPKRMLFVLGIMFLVFACMAIYKLKSNLIDLFNKQ